MAGGHGTTAAHHCGQLMVSSELCEQKPDDESWAKMVVMVGPSGDGMISPSPGSRTQHSAQQSAARPGSNTGSLSVVVRHWH